MKKKVELLAPAGNFDSFLGAVHAGADAVYLGGEKFGARAYAENFSEEQVIEAVRYAHLFHRKVYLTLNTLVKEKEMRGLYAYIKPFYEEGLDGIIVQDMGVFSFIKEQFPDLELHVSTQMAVTGVYGACLLKQLGASRIVPARELSLEEIRRMKDRTQLELETFVHGAMCYCYSGQCLFSSILGGRSGNRGRCAQPCRLPYRASGLSGRERDQYYLSLRDLCMIHRIPELAEAGIDSFKIEGRMKRAEYAAGVTAVYRKYIDLYYTDPTHLYEVEEEDLECLKSLYIRSELGEGYYYSHNGAHMVTLNRPGYGESDEEVLKHIREQYISSQKLIPVHGRAVFRIGSPCGLTLEAEGAEVHAEGDIVQEAASRPLGEEQVRRQLEKCGGTSFRMELLEIDAQPGIFLNVGSLNALRRQALDMLETAILEKRAPDRSVPRPIPEPGVQLVGDSALQADEIKELYAFTANEEQAKALLKGITHRIKGIILSYGLMEEARYSGLLHELRPLCEELYAALPYITRERDIPWLKKFIESADRLGYDGLLIRNLEQLAFVKDLGYNGKIMTDAGLYLWNKRALRFYESFAHRMTLPFELNQKEQSAVSGQNTVQVAYGRIPMMITANCIRKTCGTCGGRGRQGGNREMELTDRYQKVFPVAADCRCCYNVIYNSVPLSLHKKAAEGRSGNLRLDFTVETKEETEEILRWFLEIMEGRAAGAPPYADYTTGHEKRGVD